MFHVLYLALAFVRSIEKPSRNKYVCDDNPLTFFLSLPLARPFSAGGQADGTASSRRTSTASGVSTVSSLPLASVVRKISVCGRKINVQVVKGMVKI